MIIRIQDLTILDPHSPKVDHASLGLTSQGGNAHGPALDGRVALLFRTADGRSVDVALSPLEAQIIERGLLVSAAAAGNAMPPILPANVIPGGAAEEPAPPRLVISA